MSAGTLALTQNSTAVTGTGTAFNTDLKAGDFIVVTVGGTAYTLGVLSVTSNTALVLSQAYLGATASGVTWQAVPFATLNLITSALAQQVSYAVRGFNLDKNNWQQIFSGTGNVTVNLPDGTSWKGPAWNSFTTSLNNLSTAVGGKASNGANSDITSLSGLTTAVSVAQGGTGGKTAAEARSGLGLGAAALLKDGGALGDVSKIGDQGGPSPAYAYFQTGSAALDNVNLNAVTGTGLFPNLINGATATNTPTGSTYYYVFNIVRIPVSGSTGAMTQFIYPYYNPSTSIYKDGIIWYRGFNSGVWGPWVSVWSTNRTTVDANGFLKSASPILRLTDDSSVLSDDFGFSTIDYGQINDEAQGVKVSKLSTGVYKVTGSLGLHDTGWTIEVPQDSNGNRLCFVDTKTTKTGIITVSVFNRKFDVDSAMVVAGEAMDIPEGRWIDLRLEMPEKS